MVFAIVPKQWDKFHLQHLPISLVVPRKAVKRVAIL